MNVWTDHVRVNDESLRAKYAGRRIPMATFYEAYFNGDIDIPHDETIYDLLQERERFVKYSLTPAHFRWAITNFVPEVSIHTKDQDRRIVREHYDRGNDFFEWFLGERMVYTSGYFEHPDQDLETAQNNKMNLVCEKLRLEPGDKLLDIGCGWGTLVAHAAKHYGVDATGVTLAQKQTDYANRRIREWGVEDRARVLCRDYREIPAEQYDKIVSLEMVEHVGVKNLQSFYEDVYRLLKDDGLFVLQWAGLRRQWKWEDLIWGLFMNKYIFPGADASVPPGSMLKSQEKANFELHDIDNVSMHYAWTIRRWHDNWMANRDKIVATYGERWYRVWHFFLAWSALIATQGTSACFQMTMHKNLDAFDRGRFLTRRNPALDVRKGSGLSQPSLETLDDGDFATSVVDDGPHRVPAE